MPTQAVMDELNAPMLDYFPPAPTRTGGLGGLGGAPQQQGGFLGFLQRPGVSNTLQAIGSSLMTSPRNNPLQNFAPFYDRYSERYEKRQESGRDREAIYAVLKQNGATDQEAAQLSYNAQAAEMWLKQRLSQQGMVSDQAFNDSLSGIGGMGSTADPFSAGDVSAGSGAGRVPALLTDQRPIALVQNDPDAAVRRAPQLGEDAELPAGTGARLNGLLQIRERYVEAANQARTPQQMAKVKLRLDSIDKQIEREEERLKPTESLRELRAINEQRLAEGLPAYRLDEWQQIKAKSGATNIDLKGPSKYDEVYNSKLAERAIGIEDAATAARKSLGTLKLMEKAIADPGFYSGTGAGAVTNLKRLANSLGLPGADGIDSIEAFNALSRQAALDAMGGSLGSGFSNADRSFVEQQVANLENTPEGNSALINIQRATANRQLEIARLARAYAEKNGGRIDAGFYDRLAQWAEKNPLFTSETDIFGSGQKQGRVSGGSGRANSATGPSRQRATNPNTGETVEWDGTQWRPVQ